MRERAVAAALLLAFVCPFAYSATFVAHGPENFTRANGAPVTVTKTFAVLNPNTTYTIVIHNGGMQGQFARILSAEITVNGVAIAGPSDFNQQVDRIQKPVTLRADNTYTVELRSSPGSGITVEFVGVDNAPPQIAAVPDPAANAAGWHKTDTVVRFTCADTTSGIATCPPAVPVSTEGATPVSGTAVDKAGNTASASVTINLDKTRPSITPTVTPAPNTNGWHRNNVTVSFAGADALSGVATTSPPVTIANEGANQRADGTVTDKAGNTSASSVSVNLDRTAPTLDITSPAEGSTVFNSVLQVQGQFTDSLSGVSELTCNGTPVPQPQSPFVCNVTLAAGSNLITVVATDAAGNSAVAVTTVSYSPGSITNLTTQPGTLTAGLGTQVTVTARITPATVIAGGALVQRLNTAGAVIGTLATMRDDGTAGDAQAGDGIFTARLNLYESSPGVVRLRVSASIAGNPAATLSPVLDLTVAGVSTSIQILSPATDSYLNLSPIQVQGTIGDPSLTVTVNGVNAVKSGTSFSASVPLIEGTNTITAVSTAPGGSTGSSSVQVFLDTTPPRVTITSPIDGGHTANASVDVTGIVNDIVVGTVNPQQATVTVNGVPAQVSNRTFSFTNVQLAVGSNSIRAEARDRVGNTYAQVINVIRDAVAPGTPTIRALSGNNQTGLIGAQLAAPLAVLLTNAQNQPAANVPVIFRVTESDGRVDGLPAAIANTDAQGRAQVNFALGTRAGAGSNRVEAFATGFQGAAVFIASAQNGSAAKIVVDSGLNQTGALGQSLPFPFVAIVTDAGNNRLGGVPVTFTVAGGGGSINGLSTLSTTSDSDGRVSATLALGNQEGASNNVVEANFTGNTGQAAVFSASALAPGRADQTTISGVVLDNSNQPIPGVTIRMFRLGQGANNVLPLQIGTPVTTDAQGTFRVTNAPVGIMKLMADGATAQPFGAWPTLEYDLLTVAGRDNTVGMPIYLPRLNQVNRVCVTQTTGGTLTLPQVPGFSLTVAAGSATFPGGSRSGCISVTPVNPDKVPMAPGFGQQPRFVVTIQPVGTTFNPPARIQIPNVDGLQPRSKTEMYSYDHDLAAFVAIGTGTVSEDGSLIASDPGVGVLKAGWHCGGNPNPTGSAGTCPTCQRCANGTCVPSAGSCNDNNACTENDRCENGSCTGTPIDVPQSRVTDQFDVSFPPSLLDKVNSVFNYIPGLQGSRFDTVRVGGSTRTSDCCDQNSGMVRDGLTEKSGRFQLEINLQEGIRLWGTPRYDETFGVGGVAEVSITFEVSLTTLRGRFQFNAEVGSRDKQCEPRESCIFGELNAVQQVDLLRGTAELKACLAVFGNDVDCAGARVVIIPGRVTFGFGITYNKPSCGAGLGGTAYIGAVVARGEFSITVGGSEYRLVRQITIFQGVSGL
jgi:hypothetical protein